MKKFTLFLVLALALALAAIVFLWPGQEAVRACVVTGDVLNNVALAELPRNSYVKIPGGGRGIPLVNLVEASQPLSGEYSILLLGNDGLFAQLKGDELGGCYIVKKDGGWNTVATQHPVNAGIKDISKIVIADETEGLDFGVNIISQNENLLHLTPGNMFRQQLTCYPYLEGETELEEGYAISLFKQKQVLPLTAVTAEEINSVLVMGKGGEYERFNGAGYLELSNNEINYLHPESKTVVRNIAGAIINPPPLSIMDTYTDSLYYIDRGERVMVILIDGLSYYQFEQARDNGLIPNLAALGAAVKVNTVYRPVTNAGLAAIVTGQPPSVNGIVDRSTREPKVQTIFDLLEAEHKTHILVEGSASILKLNTDTVYSADLYNDGNTDDDVFGNAMAQIEKQPDYLLIHFHGVDDAGHNYGPLAEETMEVLAMVDVYTGLLLKEWTGKVIVVADHGMHFADPEGDHGNFQLEDMFVPYIIN